MSDATHPRCGILSVLAVLVFGGLVACDEPPEALLAPTDLLDARVAPAPQSFVVVAGEQALSDELIAAVAGLRVSIDETWPEIGVLRVTASNPAQFRAQIRGIDGIRGAAPDFELQWIDDPAPFGDFSVSAPAADAYPPDTGDDDGFFDFLWGMASIHAGDAWNAGLRGSGVRVAILDSGIDQEHADLAPNLNAALSVSFVPGLGWDIEPWMPSKHGSHVAGTVAAADNGIGVIGVAPEAELVAVRVLNEFGSGAWSWIIGGILYAASIDADLANMSLGGSISRSGYADVTPGRPAVTANEIQELLVAMTRAVSWARSQGTLVIASAGNNGRNLDHDRDLLSVPAQIPGVVSVAATSPIGWANPAVFDGNLDYPTYYTNYGNTGVSFAAPGGSVEYYYLFDDPAPPSDCTMTLASIGPQTVPCYVFDMVMSSTYNDGAGNNWYSWYQGTSMAAPHATGIAALIVGANGGDMHPAQLEAAMRSVAEDLGVPGRDPYHGLGQLRTGY
jgi:subtilisin family serine protease